MAWDGRARSAFFWVTPGSKAAQQQPNATRQALEIAGAKNERRLFPVACTRLLGWGNASDYPASGCSHPLQGRRGGRGEELLTQEVACQAADREVPLPGLLLQHA